MTQTGELFETPSTVKTLIISKQYTRIFS